MHVRMVNQNFRIYKIVHKLLLSSNICWYYRVILTIKNALVCAILISSLIHVIFTIINYYHHAILTIVSFLLCVILTIKSSRLLCNIKYVILES